IGGFELFGTVKNLEPGVVLEKYGFVWSIGNEQPDLENDNPIYLGSIDSDTSFSTQLSDVTPLYNYYVRGFAEIGKDIFYGETISFFKGDVWRQKPEVPDTRDGSYFSVVNGKAYIGGGYNAGSKYDLQTYEPKEEPEQDVWAYETPLPFLCNHGTAFTIEDTLYVVGGNDGFGDGFWAYNTMDKTWSERATFPGGARSWGVGTAVDGKGYFCLARISNNGPELDEAWRYDPVLNSWMEMPPFPGGHRKQSVVFSDEDYLYLGFGRGANDLYAFNVTTMTWEEKASIPNSLFLAEEFAAFRMEDKAYLLTSDPENNFWEYDIPTDSWKQKSDFTGTVIGNPVHFDINGKGYVGLGGENFSGNGFNWTMWEYIPDLK
ncbi:MAG: Kelch repeat-containing protein, partial [Saprospiraceae bacterium]